ncbi:hypothetical protein NSQ62_08455 [Solibacillus sp. FSL H8-0523]|uniref:hypothetical protein n=1 Tax=Solibacillus sp. FSL H8-0523 TaxID=2954511 RepID=UPI003100ECDC
MVEWHEVSNNTVGIETMAFENNEIINGYGRIVGYNGILKGDKVSFREETYTVVMVSRLGHMGLSKTGALPYIETVYPNELNKK